MSIGFPSIVNIVAHLDFSRRDKAIWRKALETWLDGVEAGWAIPVLFAGFVAIWTVTLALAYWNAGLHPDVLETWSVGREWVWGNAKHPPLMGWIAHAWTTVFPLTDWSFQLLATVNGAIALWSVDLIVRRFTRGDKRIIVLLLLLLLPAYQFHAQRFNANSVLLAVWPLATYAFMRSFESRTALWSVLAGALCAVAMLGKYYSVFLLTGFVFAAIVHPRRKDYLFSRAPWISMIAGFAALSPHLYWLATHDAEPFNYAMEVHSGIPALISTFDVVKFLLGIIAFLLAPTIAWLLMIRREWREWLRDLGDMDERLWLLTLVFIGSVIFPAVTALALASNLPAIWHLQGLFLVIVVAVCAARFPVARFDTTNLAAIVGLLLIGALIASPFHAFYRNTHPFKEGRNYFQEAAAVLTKQWHDAYGVPLHRISGDDGLAFATAFYSPDHPFYSRPFQFQYHWGMPRTVTIDDGWSALCFADDSTCMGWMERVGHRTERERRFDFTVNTEFWGRRGVPRKIAAIMVPPLAADKPKKILPPPEKNMDEEFSASRRIRSPNSH